MIFENLVKKVGREDEFVPPEKLWQWLEIAINDVEKVWKAGGKLNMDDWICSKFNGDCCVCLAGAVMICEFPEKSRRNLGYFGEGHKDEELIARAFDTLNTIRLGNVAGAVEDFYSYKSRESVIFQSSFMPVDDSDLKSAAGVEKFVSNLQAILAVLKERGL